MVVSSGVALEGNGHGTAVGMGRMYAAYLGPGGYYLGHNSICPFLQHHIALLTSCGNRYAIQCAAMWAFWHSIIVVVGCKGEVDWRLIWFI